MDYRCDELGFEVPDSRPVEVPTRLKMPLSRAEQIRAFIRHELSRSADENGRESFEEADDFSIDEAEPYSPYELRELEGQPFPASPPEAAKPEVSSPASRPHDAPAAAGVGGQIAGGENGTSPPA